MNKIIRSIIGLLTFTLPGFAAGVASNTPRLVVGIHIDQLNADYLNWFKEGFSEKGFRKLLKNGVVYQTVNYDFNNPDAASATASIVCGTTPSKHGIIAENWYDRATGNVVSCVFDPLWIGNYTTSTVSPKQLIPSTFSDELKIATKLGAKVYSVGISAEETIMAGGHEADGVYWLDDNTGKWCTSTYYNYMPWWLQLINDQRDVSGEVDQTFWKPHYPLNSYQLMPYQSTPSWFEYWIGTFGKDKFKAFKETPMVNAEVCRIGLKLMENEQLGVDAIPDYLSINLKASGILDKTRPLSAVEIQDIYFRLDLEIEKILDAVDRQVGLENALIYLIGTGEPVQQAADLSGKRSWHGDFYPERCTSLLNLYLMAIYGDENWVSAWDNQQLYLNRSLIEEKGIKLDEISQKAAAFLSEFSGVQQVVQNRLLLSGPYDNTQQEYRNSINPNHSGDFIIELQPGWNIRNNQTNTKDLQVYYGNYRTMCILYGNQLKGQLVNTPVSTGDIATTLSKVFRIRPPNACTGTLLPEILIQSN